MFKQSVKLAYNLQLSNRKQQLTINTRQNLVKVSNPCQIAAGMSFMAGNQTKLGHIKNICGRKC